MAEVPERLSVSFKRFAKPNAIDLASYNEALAKATAEKSALASAK
jgi:hypothetical protein